MNTGEELLAGGNMGPVTRRGDEVQRVSGEWTPAVHRLLAHCRSRGFLGAPEPRGVQDDGREVLSYIRGDVPQDPMPDWVWTDTALASCAQLLREFHEVSATAPRNGPWRSPHREPAEVVCHNDFAPYNLVFDRGRAVGVIDFDYASPGPRIWDLAYLAYRIVPFTGDQSAGLDDHQRRVRLARLLDAYGTSHSAQEVLSTMIVRLEELAIFSEAKAVELEKPELADHARGYRRDAAELGKQLRSS